MNLFILGITVGLVVITLAKPTYNDQNYIENLESENPALDNYFNTVMESTEELPNRGLVERKNVRRPPFPCGINGCVTRRTVRPPRYCDPLPCQPTPKYPYPYPMPYPPPIEPSYSDSYRSPQSFQRKSASGSDNTAESNERVASLFDKIGSAAASLI